MFTCLNSLVAFKALFKLIKLGLILNCDKIVYCWKNLQKLLVNFRINDKEIASNT